MKIINFSKTTFPNNIKEDWRHSVGNPSHRGRHGAKINTAIEAKIYKQEQLDDKIEKKIAKVAEREAKLAASRNNPSGVVSLKINKKPKGTRHEVNLKLYGQGYTDKIYQLNNVIKGMLLDDEEEHIKLINTEKYFNNLFYGKFPDLNPKKVSWGLTGSKDYFPEFYNAFMFYTNEKYGDNYYPNMVRKDFVINTKRFKGDRMESETDTPFTVYLPVTFLNKFELYLNTNQFSWSGETFEFEFEWLILSFLNNYNPDSLAFKQMMQNLYRYANNKPPAKAQAELLNSKF